MELKLVEILAPRGVWREISSTLLAYKTGEIRVTNISPKTKSIKFFANTANARELLTTFEKRFYKKEGFRIIILSVDATLPRLEEDQLPDQTIKKTPPKKKRMVLSSLLLKIHSEELYQGVLLGTELTVNKIFLYILAAIVATIGFAYNNIAIIIGSMVIAPFLGPNVGLALGTTLGDKELMAKALKNLFVGTALVLVISIMIGMFYIGAAELESQVYVTIYMIILSLVSGVSAILYLLEHNESGLVGVMVAVSLLPPLTLSGLLLGSGVFLPAFKSFLLFLINVVCLNLAGISTFLAAGVRPTNWREIKKAKQKTRIAIIIWLILLVLIGVFIYIFSQ